MTTGSKALIAALGACLLAGCGASPAENVTSGDKALAAHSFAAARTDYIAALREEPDNRDALTGLAKAYLAEHDPAAANEVLERLRKAGGTQSARLLQAQAAGQLGRFDEVLRLIGNDASAEAWRLRAAAHLGLSQPDRAEAAFRSGLHANGNKARLLADYANFRLGLNDRVHARRLAQLAVRADPSELTALLVRASIFMIDGQVKKGLMDYDRAARLYPEDRDALLGRIGAMAQAGMLPQVRPLVAQARERNPGDTDLLYLDARLAAQDKDWQRVRSLLQPYETGLAGMPAANLLYARALLKLGQTEQARVRMASHLLRMPGDREARVLLGEARLAVGDAEGALETLQPVLQWPDASREERALLARVQAAATGG